MKWQQSAVLSRESVRAWLRALELQGAGIGTTIIDGASQFRIFFVGYTGKTPTVSFKNMTIQNAKAKGGSGSGGGAGLGAGLFMYSGAVTVDTVRFANNQAIGGTGLGGINSYIGGGGLGGNGSINGNGGGPNGGAGGSGSLGGRGGNGGPGRANGNKGGKRGGGGTQAGTPQNAG